MSDPNKRISALSSPCALEVSVLLNVCEQTNSPSRSVRWAAVPRTGRISCSSTWTHSLFVERARREARQVLLLTAGLERRNRLKSVNNRHGTPLVTIGLVYLSFPQKSRHGVYAALSGTSSDVC